MKDRELLQINSKICLISIEDGSLGEFTITDICGQGGSAICYKAARNKRKGILKEFYPLDSDTKQYAVNLSRRNHADSKLRGQLYSADTTISNFIKLRDAYYDSCKEIVAAKTDEEDLNNFIPRIEIFKSYVDDENDSNFTYYTWVLEDTNMKPFEEILGDICADIKNNESKGKNALLVLDCILELAKCICLLHLSGLLHLDLTPANFGVSTYRGTANKNVSISLYDTNTIYSQRFNNCISAGTPGFRSPEVEKGKRDEYSIQSDIYSIGAILYYAFVVDEDFRNCRYSGEENGKKSFDLIADDLKRSLLLRFSDNTINVFLYNSLLSIIKKALNIYDDACGRFEKTEELIEALEQLKNKFGIFVGEEELKNYGEEWIETKTKTKEEHYNETVKTGASGAIQWLLYRYPLYDYQFGKEKDKSIMNVLVYGCGTYAQKFIDTAFELSQIERLHLDITVACENPERDKNFYLSERPEFCNFFSVDGNDECERTSEPYGRVEFKKAHFNLRKVDYNFKNLLYGKNYSYVFIALNDERLNKEVALTCSKHLQEKNGALISYVIYNKAGCREREDNGNRMIPVCVTDTFIEQEEYKYLEQMALNVHLLWSPFGLSNLQKSTESFFENPYNYNSSLKNALSIKYKLHSIGIDINSNNRNMVASAFQSKLKGNEDSLIMYEQKRWNVGQITDGWRVLEKEEFGFLKTDTKSITEKKHPIICDAAAERPLDKWGKDKWYNASAEEIGKLDTLDQTSVFMHRYFTKMSEQARGRITLINGRMELLSKIISKNARLVNGLSFFENTVKRMLTENSPNKNLLNSYNYYRNFFEGEAKKCGSDVYVQVKELLKYIDEELFPVIQAWSYKNWKNNNVALIENIPFVLTYSRNIHICMPMVLDSCGYNSKLFSNVASAIKINPKKVTYIVDGDDVVENGQSLVDALQFIASFFSAHEVQANIDLVILKSAYIDNNLININQLKEKFGIINKIDFIDYDVINKQAVLRSFLIDNQSADNSENHFYALEYNDSNIGTLMKNANADFCNTESNIVPAFYFNENKQSFVADAECDWLNYIPNEPKLHADELFADNEVNFSEPELSSRIDLLDDILRNEYALWCKLCSIVREKNERNRKLIEFSLMETEETEEICEFVFPSACEKAVGKIVDRLIFYNIVSPESAIHYLTSKSNLLRAYKISEDNKFALEQLFANYTRLTDSSLIDVQKESGRVVICADDQLGVYNLSLDERFSSDEKEQCAHMLKKMSKNFFITGLKINNTSEISFMFPSVYEKSLMNNGRKLIQAVVYYKLLESELFDDIQSGVDVKTDNGMVFKIDAIAIKGFRTFLFVSVSSDSEAERILSDITEKYGINSMVIYIKSETCDNGKGELNEKPVLFADDYFAENLKKFISK